MAAENAGTKKGKQKGEDITVPDKLYFRIGEVAALLELPTYVLRFWESEFSQLKPSKSSTGQRLYRKRDVELLILIKRLLYQDGYTIAGARQWLKDEASKAREQTTLFPANSKVMPNRSDDLKRVRNELELVRAILMGH
jgi:DNA-binding transcriptional MerR regulator